MFPTRWSVDILRHTAGAPDAYGNPASTYAAPVSAPVYGWAPRGSSESSGWQSTVVADLVLFAPADFTVTPQDRVVVAGRTYEVEGEPEGFNNGPFGFAPGVQVNLRRVTG